MALRKPIATKYGRDQIVNYGLNVALDQAGQVRDRIERAGITRDNRQAMGDYSRQLRDAKTSEERSFVFESAFIDPRLSTANREIFGRYLAAGRNSGGIDDAAIMEGLTAAKKPDAETAADNAAVTPAATATSTTENKANGDVKRTTSLPVAAINTVSNIDLGVTADSLEPGLAKVGANILDAGASVVSANPVVRGATSVRNALPSAVDATLNALGPDAQPTNFTGNPNLGTTSTGAPLIPGAEIPVQTAPIPGTPQASLGERLLNAVVPTAAADDLVVQPQGVIPTTPVARTQAALDYYGSANPATVGRKGGFAPVDVPAPPLRPTVAVGPQGFPVDVPRSDRVGISDFPQQPLPDAITSPLPAEPVITGQPLDPVARTQQALDGFVNPPAPVVGLPVNQTPQQQEILENNFANQPSNRIAEFRQLNNLPAIPQEEASRLDGFLGALNRGVEGFSESITGLPSTPPTAAERFDARVRNAAAEPFVEGFSAGRDAAPATQPVSLNPSDSFISGLAEGTGYTNPQQLDSLFTGATSDMSIPGMVEVLQTNAGLTGNDVDGLFGPTTVGALQQYGMSNDDINTLQQDMVRERILAGGRYQYIGDTLNEAVGYYNQDNPTSPITSDTIFSPELQDGILDSHVQRLSPVAVTASNGGYANADPDVKLKAANDLMYSLAQVWKGLPDPRRLLPDGSNNPAYGRSTSEKNGRNRANLTIPELQTVVENFINTGDMTGIRNAIGEAESDSLGGYNAANQPDTYLLDANGNGNFVRGQYDGEAGGNVSSLTMGQLLSKLNDSNQTTPSS